MVTYETHHLGDTDPCLHLSQSHGPMFPICGLETPHSDSLGTQGGGGPESLFQHERKGEKEMKNKTDHTALEQNRVWVSTRPGGRGRGGGRERERKKDKSRAWRLRRGLRDLR